MLFFCRKRRKLGSKPNTMKKIFHSKSIIALAILWFHFLPGLSAQAGWERTAKQLLAEAVASEQCVGIAAGFITRDGSYWMDGAGLRDQKNEASFTTRTLTRIASISKSMTAVAVLQLYEQGLLDLDAPIQTYLPDFPKKAAGEITIRHLLQHSSGIDAYRSNRERENKQHYEDLEAAVRIFQDRDLVHRPGTDFHYTTYGYVLLGLIIERVSGLTYPAYMRRHIWQPAGMEYTGVEVAGEQISEKSALYHLRSGKKLKSVTPTDLSDRIPGGGIYSTVSDLLKFGKALLSGQLIQPDTRALMWQDPALKGEGNGYGMGWYLYSDNPALGPVFGHNGAQTGASTFLMLLPEQETAIAVLSNTSGAMQTVSDITVRLLEVVKQAIE